MFNLKARQSTLKRRILSVTLQTLLAENMPVCLKALKLSDLQHKSPMFKKTSGLFFAIFAYFSVITKLFLR
jgi:hypothetical protein